VLARLVLLFAVVAMLAANASAAATPENRLCQAIAVSNHLKANKTCPLKAAAGSLSFTVGTKAPAGFQSTIAYTIIDNKTDAAAAWQEDAETGAETTLPAAGHVSNLSEPSYLYLASGQPEAEAAAFVGTAIVDVILVPLAANADTTGLKSNIESILRSAVALVRADESREAG
jgi:hypothetical protein